MKKKQDGIVTGAILAVILAVVALTDGHIEKKGFTETKEICSRVINVDSPLGAKQIYKPGDEVCYMIEMIKVKL